MGQSATTNSSGCYNGRGDEEYTVCDVSVKFSSHRVLIADVACHQSSRSSTTSYCPPSDYKMPAQLFLALWTLLSFAHSKSHVILLHCVHSGSSLRFC